jgi:hypothetical protein
VLWGRLLSLFFKESGLGLLFFFHGEAVKSFRGSGEHPLRARLYKISGQGSITYKVEELNRLAKKQASSRRILKLRPWPKLGYGSCCPCH